MTSKISEVKISGTESRSILGSIWNISWRIGRVFGYLLVFLTILWFWWSWVGIAIGISFYLLTKSPAWKRNWLVLAFIIGFSTLLVEGLNIFYLLLGALIFGIYIISVFFISLGGWILKKIRKSSGPKAAQLSKGIKKTSKKVRIGFKVALIILPILMWSVVSLDFGVMFDNNPKLLWIHSPSTVTLGETFEITVEAWDVYERLSSNYNGQVEFALRSYNLTTLTSMNSNASLPNPYIFTGQALNLGGVPAYEIQDGKDNGRHVFSAQINTTGIHYILVNDSLTGNSYFSNPILVENYTGNDRMLYWGDVHSHSILSDGSGSPEHSHYFARYVACLEFYALTDHGEDLSLSGLSDWGFGIAESAANQANEPGEFVVFQGVEWTPHYPPAFNVDYGHYTCIFSGDEVPFLGAHVQTSPVALWNALDAFCNQTGDNALAMPHHTVRNQFIQDWTYLNPKYVKIAEVTSVHGECLYESRDPLSYRGSVDPTPEFIHGAAIIDAFKMGHRMTLCASGDNHDGHPGHSLSHTDAYIGHQYPYALDFARNGHPYPSGLTAVFAQNLTRNSVFEGLDNQRIFANSDYGRPFINFTINGVPVGEGSTVYVATNTTQRNISIFLAQDGAPAPRKSTAASVTPNWEPNWNVTIELIKNGMLRNSTIKTTPVSRWEFTDPSLINGTSYTESIQIDGDWFINQYSDQAINPLNLTTKGADFYVLRIVGANGRTSYAGPIWVEVL